MVLKKLWLLTLSLVSAGLLVAACGQSPAQTEKSVTVNPAAEQNQAAANPFTGLPKNADGFTDITVAQLAETLPLKNYTLVNVHIPYAGDLPQTDLSIPFNEIANYQDQLPDKDAPVVLYCRSGNMSTQAAQTLVGLGYTNVVEVDGGMVAWQSAGNQLVDK